MNGTPCSGIEAENPAGPYYTLKSIERSGKNPLCSRFFNPHSLGLTTSPDGDWHSTHPVSPPVPVAKGRPRCAKGKCLRGSGGDNRGEKNSKGDQGWAGAGHYVESVENDVGRGEWEGVASTSRRVEATPSQLRSEKVLSGVDGKINKMSPNNCRRC